MHVISFSYARGVFNEGGKERARMERYAALLDSLTLIVFSRRERGALREFRSGKLRAIATNSKSKAHILFDTYRMGKKVLLARKSDDEYVITSQDPFESGLVGAFLARKMRVRHRIEVHGSFFEGAAWRRESFGNRIRWYLGRHLLRRAENIRVVSERIRHTLIAMGVKEECITVLPILAELEPLLTAQKKKREGEAGDVEPIRILYVGRLAREKNIPLLIRSVGALKKEFSGLYVRIVGSGVEHERLRLLIQSLGADTFVELVPWTNDVSGEMLCADIFALASNHEGYALVLLEAMAASIPVVTTDVGCAGDVLRNGVEGIVVPVGDANAFTEALRTLIENPELRDTYGRAGRARAREVARVTPEEYAKQWVASLYGRRGQV